MKSKNVLKAVVTAVVTGALTISAGVVAFADTNPQSGKKNINNPAYTEASQSSKVQLEGLTAAELDELVKAGIITQSEADSMKRLLKKQENSTNSSNIKAMVDEGIITNEKLDKINNYSLEKQNSQKLQAVQTQSKGYMDANAHSWNAGTNTYSWNSGTYSWGNSSSLTSALQTYVTAETIDSEELSEIIQYVNSNSTNVRSELVSEDIISSSQANSISSAFNETSISDIKENLEDYVDSDVISSSEKNSIISYVKKVNNALLSDLVDEDIITSSQASKLKDVFLLNY